MKAVTFKHQTLVLGEGQPQYEDLPVYVSPDEKSQMISCHELDESELELINKTKRIWQSQMTFGGKYNPTWLSIEYPFNDDPTNVEDKKPTEYATISQVAKMYGHKVRFDMVEDEEFVICERVVDSKFLNDMETGVIRMVEFYDIVNQ